MQGTNKAHKNGEAMGLVGVRLTDQLGIGFGQSRIAGIFKHVPNLLRHPALPVTVNFSDKKTLPITSSVAFFEFFAEITCA